jgi:adenosylmethionine-8-amino-7-oxononanoate aminotransferase
VDLLAADGAHTWHPYASAGAAPFGVVAGASGVRLAFDDGRELLDGMSSWWASIHGYRHPALDDAVREQLGAVAHVMFGGLTHEPAVRLCERLARMTGLDHVFLADSGSVSVEVALKMALQFQRGAGQPGRTRFLTIRGGYHGDTLGAMGVSDPVGGMHEMFTEVLAPTVHLPRPPAGLGADLTDWLAAAEPLAEAHADQIAAIIVEPVLQGAGGMYIYPPAVLQILREWADRHGWLLILDEIATGFCRTGTWFAADHAGVRPDVMCVGKALSGGYVSLAAALCSAEVVAGIEASESKALMHGPTFMGNPLACAVANASLDLLEAGDPLATVARIERELAAGLAPAFDLPGVRDVRTLGAVGVVQLEHPVDVAKATEAAAEHGVWIRPFRDLLYLMPPYVSTSADIAQMAGAVVAAAEVLA